jgi:hypothetical protein
MAAGIGSKSIEIEAFPTGTGPFQIGISLIPVGNEAISVETAAKSIGIRAVPIDFGAMKSKQDRKIFRSCITYMFTCQQQEENL